MSLNNLLYTIHSADHYESISHYEPAPHYRELASRLLGPDWHFRREGIWCVVGSDRTEMKTQGWKIHISATPADGCLVLAIVCRALRDRTIGFKFAVDQAMHRIINTKAWPRGGAGKFITLYPPSDSEFVSTLEMLYPLLNSLEGPSILSDRRYRDSKLLYYRYGGFTPARSVGVEGDRVTFLAGPFGELVRDERPAYFNPPSWVRDPVGPTEEESDQEESGTLCKGRYRVESALGFSSTGGIYLGRDQRTDSAIVIKESRPKTFALAPGFDSVSLLAKEYRLLRTLEAERIAPAPIELFRDWEHYYLVQELIVGETLRAFTARRAIALKHQPVQADFDAFYRWYLRLFTRLARALAILHQHRIVFSDLSLYNIMVVGDGDAVDVRLVDFEGAHEASVDVAPPLQTAGFNSAEQARSGRATAEDDCYGLGALMVAAIMPVTSILSLDRNAYQRFVDAFERDLRLPPSAAACIRRLLDADAATRPSAEEVATLLAAETEPAPAMPSMTISPPAVLNSCDRMLSYLHSVADHSRTDRLFPADPSVFRTNPLNIAYGATGVAYAHHLIAGKTPQPWIDWILKQPIDRNEYAPGLFIGLAGIAWVFDELGYEREATTIAKMALDHPLTRRCPDVMLGASGIAMLELKLFLRTLSEEHLDNATGLADEIIRSARRSPEGLSWKSRDNVYYGYAHGASGIALTLLYVYLACGKAQYLDAALEGLRFELAHGIDSSDGGLTWRIHEGHPTVVPYWRYGSAGVGTALIRFYQVTRDRTLLDSLRRILIDTDRKYTIYPGRFFGLAGLGDFAADLYRLPELRYASAVAGRRVLDGLALFEVQRPEGTAFPGEGLQRLSCDYGTGSAGIALTIHRLANPACPPAFQLDELLRQHPAEPPERIVMAEATESKP